MPPHEQKQPTSLTEIFNKISSEDTRRAFLYLIANSARLSEYHTNSSGAGGKKHFGYWKGRSYRFAFIGNSNWLLFYFRQPLFESISAAKAKVLAKYPQAETNPEGELTIKIKTLSDAVKLQEFLEILA